MKPLNYVLQMVDCRSDLLKSLLVHRLTLYYSESSKTSVIDFLEGTIYNTSSSWRHLSQTVDDSFPIQRFITV